MKRITKAIIAIFLLIALTIAACSSDDTNAKKANKGARDKASDTNQEFAAPEVENYVEYHNYIRKAELEDSPSNIIWCTTTWGNASAPLVTLPISGKLTSSSVSLFPSTQEKTYENAGTYNPELTSFDAMYHGTPPPYRFGFTPGGQYVDFFNMPTLCTTALTEFQRQSTEVSVTVDEAITKAQSSAEAALDKCLKDQTKTKTETELCPAAQDALNGIAGG